MKPETYAVIDVGSNSTKVKIATRLSGGNFNQIFYEDFNAPLIATSSEKKIEPKSLDKCISALKEIQTLINKYKVTKQKTISTEALRKASNRAEVLAEIKKQTGIDIEVISGEREAELTLRAVQIDVAGVNLVCINGGGGSTELCFHFEAADKFHTFDFGANNLTENFIKKTTDVESAYNGIKTLIEKEFLSVDQSWVANAEDVISIGGSIYAAAFILKKDANREFDKLNQFQIRAGELESLVHKLMTTPVEELLKLPGADEKRMEILLAGVLIHLTVLKLMNKSVLTINTRSISDAVMLEF